MTVFQKDLCYNFPVVNQDNPNATEFLLEVDTPEGKRHLPLKKLDFQQSPDYIIPATLKCRVKTFTDEGYPILAHDIPGYVYELYYGVFNRHESFECEVIGVPNNPREEPYTICDSYGIYYRLREPESILNKGQHVSCRLTRLTPNYFSLERDDEVCRLVYVTPRELLYNAEVSRRLADILIRRIYSLEAFESVRDDIAAENPEWIVSAGRIIMQQLPEWFRDGKLRKQNGTYRRLIEAVRKVFLYILEGSGMLNPATPEQRSVLRQQLTEWVESLRPYEITLRIIDRGEQDVYVEDLLDKLQRSGFLYHPARQFSVLMLIFRLYPDKVATYLSRIFESIFGRDIENWSREPFRSAFVEQFEIYIKQARHSIDELPIGETREQKLRIETIVMAIALQRLLAGSDAGDYRRSWSLFFRYISLLRPLNTEALLSKSFLALLGCKVNFHPTYEGLKQPMMMMTQATVMTDANPLSAIKGTYRYCDKGLEIVISDEGLSIHQQSQRGAATPVVPAGLMNWLKPQVYTHPVSNLSARRKNQLDEHNRLWQNIETNLFAERVPTKQTTTTLSKAAKDDQLYIIIEGVEKENDNDPTFLCRISDENYLDGTGILKRSAIVGYNLKNPPMRAYYDFNTRSPRGFFAKVIDVRNDGSYIFSLLKEVTEYAQDNFNLQDTYTAVITYVGDTYYSAISSMGVGISLQRDADAQDFKVRDIVSFQFTQLGIQGQFRGTIIDLVDDPEAVFKNDDAFARLMTAIGVVATEEEEPEEEPDVMRDIDEMLSPDQVREIIDIIRFKVIAERELTRAYDYLRFARLMALIIDDQRMAERLRIYARLLTMHQYFATNSRVDPEEIENLRPEVEGYPLLQMVFHRLEIVSWLGQQHHNADLFRISAEPTNELEGSIAQMVLAYNMVHANDGDNEIASDIRNHIKEKLNVNSETRHGKYYGYESKYIEFKTSLVYPATTPGDEIREDPEAQQMHILSRIAGFLNSGGGRLYLGVNNDGYEVGLHDDFKYYERHKAMARNYAFKISSIDNLTVFIEELINQYFDHNVSRKISVSVDDEAEKGVVLIEVEQSLEPVFLEGRLFVRQSGQATREYHGEAIEDFKKEREMLRAERMLQHPAPAAPELKEEAAPEAPAKAAKSPAADDTAADSPATPTLATSSWRPNVLHEYDDGFESLHGYLYFSNRGKVAFSSKDLWRETGVDDCVLALAVPHGLANGYLVLAYDNEKAIKVPLKHIYDAGENEGIAFGYDSQRPIFAALAAPGDALLCLGADSTGTLYRRATPLTQIKEGTLVHEPRRIHDTTIHHTAGFEIIDSSSLDLMSDCLPDNLPSKRFGITLAVKENAPGKEAKLNELFNRCVPVL